MRALALSRAGGWLGFYAAVAAAWGGLLWLLAAQAPDLPAGAPAALWESLCLSAGAAGFPALVAMWALMAAAMMLPSFAPAYAAFRALPVPGAGAAAVALVAGYLALWLGAAAAGAAAQAALARAGALTPWGALAEPWAAAALLLGAGAWQLSGPKAACLARCRHPLTFFLERWRPGPGPAFGMGVSLGMHCLGCCWALMALGFVGGTMNLGWMALATAFMAAEKLPGLGRRLTAPAGAALIAAGLWAGLGAAGFH